MIKLSLIIVAYKNGEILKKELESIRKYNDLGEELEVIVVDNSPEEEKLEWLIGKFDLPNYKYIKADNNGFGASNNIGANIASGDVLGFVNPDIIFIENIFNKIYHCFNDEGNLRIMGCKLLDKNYNSNYSFFMDIYDSFYKTILIKIAHRFEIFDNKNMFTSGSNIFMRKEDFCKTGMFDENIFMYYEELDLKYRAIKVFGYEGIKYNKNIKMIHLEGIKRHPFSEKNIINNLNSLIYVCNKHKINYLKKLKFDLKLYLLKSLLNVMLGKENNDRKMVSIIKKYCKDNSIKL